MIYLIRGLPGAGKSYKARKVGAEISPSFDITVSADDFMPYPNFDPKLIPECHRKCQDKVKALLAKSWDAIVHNTFTQKWEMVPYHSIAAGFGTIVQVIDIFDGGLTDAELAAQNVHGVPVEVIAKMRARWEKV